MRQAMRELRSRRMCAVVGMCEGRCSMFDVLEARQLLVFDPSPNEQYLMELLNRMRMNPGAELALLTTSLGNPARSSDPNVDSALRYFHTSGTVLAQQWAALTAVPPLAWNDLLYAAADGHNAAMIASDQQTHQAPGEAALGARATNAGYTNWSQVGENVYAYAEGVVHTHAGFALDWGGDPTDPNTTGIQNPPGHRDNMMDATYREVGIRIATPGNVAGRTVGPWVVTQDFGRRFNQGNPFLLGVVYADASSDGYSPGEGFGGVTISAVAGDGSAGAPTYTTTSMTAGGWQVQLPAGTYAVTFSGAGWGAPVTYHGVSVGSQNAKLDASRGVAPPAPIIQVSGNGMVIPAGDTTPLLADNTNFGNANPTLQSNTRTFTIFNAGNRNLRLGNFTHVLIGGRNSSDFRLTSDASTNIGPGGSTTFTIVFDPSALGVRNATVTIQSNDPGAPSYSFSILGRGVRRPIMQVSGHRQVIANADDSPTTADWTNFAGLNAQFATKVRIFTITNIGLAAMNLGGPGGAPAVTLTGPNADLFSVFVQPASRLAPGASTQFRVRFSPNGNVGFAYADIHIVGSDPLTPDGSFAIRANGLAQPRLQLSCAGVTIPAGDATPRAADRTDFGSVAVTNATRVRLFTIRNIGLADLVLTGATFVTIAGLNPGDFAVSRRPAGATIGAGQSETFRVRFDPTGAGARGAVVRILTNDPALAGFGGIFTFAIGGIGV